MAEYKTYELVIYDITKTELADIEDKLNKMYIGYSIVDPKESYTTTANRLIDDLMSELYPKELGKVAEMRADPTMSLVIISKYEGMSSLLKQFGADTTELDNLINKELEKLQQ